MPFSYSKYLAPIATAFSLATGNVVLAQATKPAAAPTTPTSEEACLAGALKTIAKDTPASHEPPERNNNTAKRNEAGTRIAVFTGGKASSNPLNEFAERQKAYNYISGNMDMAGIPGCKELLVGATADKNKPVADPRVPGSPFKYKEMPAVCAGFVPNVLQGPGVPSGFGTAVLDVLNHKGPGLSPYSVGYINKAAVSLAEKGYFPAGDKCVAAMGARLGNMIGSPAPGR